MQRPCHKEALFVERIKRALGVDVRPVQCHIVDTDGMAKVMTNVGWSRNETDNVVGFQVGDNVYVRTDSKWTTLHELVHRSGINADRMNRYVAEGLTEAIASILGTAPDEYQPTYPEETAWVRNVLLPKLGLDALALGKILAHSNDPPRTLADLIAEKDPNVNRVQLRDDLKPQRPNKPELGSRSMIVSSSKKGFLVHVERSFPSGLGLAMIVAGLGLVVAGLSTTSDPASDVLRK